MPPPFLAFLMVVCLEALSLAWRHKARWEGGGELVQCPRVEVEGHKYDCGKLAHVLIWSSRGLQKLPRVLVWSSQAPPRAGTRSRLAVSHTGKFILVSVCVCVCVRARGAWSSEVSAEMILYFYIKI